MTQNLQPFVKDSLPDFVKADHPTFQLFLEAYYEWMEHQNDSETTNVKQLYRSVPNPGKIVNSIDTYRDIDYTLDNFIQYFANEIVPIAIDGNQVTDSFMLKKMRDVYLAKGTPNSFKLLFRMLYNNEIDIFTPKDSILEASEGKFLSFQTVKVRGPVNLPANFSFDLATLAIDSNNSVLITDAQTVDFTSSTIYQLYLNTDVELPIGREYTITDANDSSLTVDVTVVAQIESISITGDSTSNYRPRDYITIHGLDADGNRTNQSVRLEIQTVTRGGVDRIFVRNRGENYQVGDTINFFTEDSIGGAGASATITEVDNNGRITAIDGVRTRSGRLNTGFLSDDFEEARIPIVNRGDYDVLPKTEIASVAGQGAQIFPITDTIGNINEVVLLETGNFEADSDGATSFFEVEIPLTFATISETEFEIGSTIEFQYFDADSDAFAADSEVINYSFSIVDRDLYDSDPNGLYVDSDGTFVLLSSVSGPRYYDSDTGILIVDRFRSVNRLADTFIDLPIGLDSDTFEWITKRYVISQLDSEGDIRARWDSDVRFNNVNDSDGTITDVRINRLDSFHFDRLSRYDRNDDDVMASFERAAVDVRNPVTRDVGQFRGTFLGGRVYSRNKEGTQYTIIANTTARGIDADQPLTLPTVEQLQAFDNIGNSIIRAVQINPVTGVIQTEDDFPISTNVSQYDRADGVDIVWKGSAASQKRFISEDGFLNSSSGGVLRDNYIYSEFSYIIQTTVPINTWRQKIKETLHPAGMILAAELNADSVVQTDVSTIAESNTPSETANMTFDSTYDYYSEDQRPGIVLADNTTFEANAFNLITGEVNAEGRVNSIFLTADLYQNAIPQEILSQAGNSWWDYEPVGLVQQVRLGTEEQINRLRYYDSDGVDKLRVNFDSEDYLIDLTTQDSDGNGRVANQVTYYNYRDGTAQDFYKTNNRYTGINVIETVNVNFLDRVNNAWEVFGDSEQGRLLRHIVTFDDSELTPRFRAIPYDLFRVDSDIYYDQEIPRNQELKVQKERDFAKAMFEDRRLTYVEGDVTYYDYEAYNRKWNLINTLRDQDDGWIIMGENQIAQNISGNELNRYQRVLEKQRGSLSKVKTPLTAEQLGNGTLAYREYYLNDEVAPASLRPDYSYTSDIKYDEADLLRRRRR